MGEIYSTSLQIAFKHSFSVLCGFAVLGGVTNWLLHSRFCEKVKEKSWAMLAVFLCPYVGYSIYGMWLIVSGNFWLWYVFNSLSLSSAH